jgi:Zn-dependent protease
MAMIQYRIGFLTTSDIEIRDLFRAWIAIAVAFALYLTGHIFTMDFLDNFILAALSVGVAFLFHELSHKAVAQHFGCFAEFRAYGFMLFLGILMSFMGFLFIAPGAVMISGPVGLRRNGKISMAGPGMNLLLAIIILGILIVYQPAGFLKNVLGYGFMINTWLALFNMIPFWNFDGKKILAWNKFVYITMLVVGFVLLLIQAKFT